MARIVDLSIPIENGTPLPPPVERKVTIEVFNYPPPGFLQASWLTVYSHTASHVDSPLHVLQNEKTIAEVSLEDVIGEAVVIDLTHLGDQAPITPEVLVPHESEMREGDIVILRTDWTDKKWPTDDYWVQSPYLTEEGAQWLAERKPKAIAFDFFEEWCPRFVDFDPKDFVAHRALMSQGIILIEGLTGIGKLKKKRVQLFAAPVKFSSRVEAAPARIFAIEN